MLRLILNAVLVVQQMGVYDISSETLEVTHVRLLGSIFHK